MRHIIVVIVIIIVQIIMLIKGGKYHYIDDMTTEKMKYWTHKYRLEAVVQMQKLIETSMIESTFNQVTCPVFSGFYYRNEKEQDQVVSVDHMREMFTIMGYLDSHVYQYEVYMHEVDTLTVSYDI